MVYTIDEITKIIGTCFTFVTVIISVLMFLSARKALLNSINAEYQKHVITRVDELSKELSKEFDPSSEKYYWTRYNEYLYEHIQKINVQLAHNEGFAILQKNNYVIESNPQIVHLRTMLNNIKSDPFIPKQIRKSVETQISRRVDTLNSIYYHNLKKYIIDLKNLKPSENLETRCVNLINAINLESYREECGICQMEEETNNIRLYIQQYFERFMPVKRSQKLYTPIFGYKRASSRFIILKKLTALRDFLKKKLIRF